jgi:putative membrane protein
MHRLAFPPSDLALEAEHRAQAEFYASDLRSTTGRTGVLLFVSMLERRAVILADEAIIAKFEKTTWTDTLSALLQAIRNGEMGKGYVVAIESIGRQLQQHFPLAHDDRDELANTLRISE